MSRAPSKILTLDQDQEKGVAHNVQTRMVPAPSTTTVRKLGGKRRRKPPALKNPLLNDF